MKHFNWSYMSLIKSYEMFNSLNITSSFVTGNNHIVTLV